MGYRVAPAVLAAALLSVLIAPVAFAADLVPDVVGLELEKAQELLARAGYDATLDFDASKPAGIVFGQSPGGLAGRPKGTRVTLNVGGTAPDRPAPGPDLPPAGPAPVAPAPVAPTPVAPTPADPTPSAPTAPPGDDGLGTPPGGTLPRDPLDLGDPPTGKPGAPVVEPPAAKDPEPAAPSDPEPAPILPGAGTPPEPGPGVTPAPGPATTGDARLDAMPFAPRLDRSGPEVPDVLGRTRAAALNALAGWMVREELTLSVPSLVGTVINQWPKPGMTLAPGEPVTMQVAVAQSPSINHRSVPVLIGKSVPEVERTLQRFGFSGQFSKVLSRPARFAKGVWQQPMPGSLAPEGTVVVVNFGAGDGTPRAAKPSPTGPAPLATDPMTPIAPSGSSGTKDPTPLDPDAPPAGMPALPPLGDPPTGPEAKPPVDLLPPAGPLPPAPGPQDPAPRDPAPRDPAPRDPAPRDPAPRDPVPQDPAPRDPSGTRRPLARPKLISPPAGESYPRAYGATFEWSASSGATGYDWELEEEQPSGAWRKVDKANVSKSRYRPERMKRGRYRWRVRATAGDRSSDWSGWFRLYMY